MVASSANAETMSVVTGSRPETAQRTRLAINPTTAPTRPIQIAVRYNFTFVSFEIMIVRSWFVGWVGACVRSFLVGQREIEDGFLLGFEFFGRECLHTFQQRLDSTRVESDEVAMLVG